MSQNRLADGPLVVALDSSTTATKAIIVDAAGNVWETAKQEIQLLEPGMDCYEHDPRQWWQSTHDTIGEVLSRLTQKERDRVKAIGITHQRESFAPFDEKGEPLRNGILWLDGRATEQIRKYGSSEIHKLSGKPPGVTPGLYKMIWVNEHEPEVFQKAHKIIDVHGYIAFNLTGNWVSSSAATDSLGVLDIQNFDYSDKLLELCGLTREKMPTLAQPGESMGTVRPELMQEWGLTGEVQVIAGMGDGQAAGIGAAAVRPEVAFLNLGTAVNAGVSSPTYAYDPVFRTHLNGIPGGFVFEILLSSGSFLATWFRRKFGDPGLAGAPDSGLEKEATEVEPGCEGLLTLPYWNAVQSPYWDSVARGGIVGWRGIHGKAHMYRSILESIGYEMCINLESIEKGTGVKVETIRAMGGGTRSPLWRQIMADTIGLPITLCLEDEIAALGAAVVAMAAIDNPGAPDVAKHAEAMANFGEVIEPNLDLHAKYMEYLAIQRKLYPALKDVFEDLYNLSTK